jgi:hypothetical protein
MTPTKLVHERWKLRQTVDRLFAGHRAERLTEEAHHLRAQQRLRAMGFKPYEPDPDRDALIAIQHRAQAAEQSKREQLDVIATQSRQQAWQEERARIMRTRHKLKREAEERGEDAVFFWPELPHAVPIWFEAPPDGAVTEHTDPSIPMVRYNDNGTTTIQLANDAITGREPGPPLLTPEESLRLQAAGKLA